MSGNSTNQRTNQLINTFCSYSYESNISKDPEKERVKADFQETIQFVENYLEAVSTEGSFADREQNKLTYEVCWLGGTINEQNKLTYKVNWLGGTINQ